MSVTDHKHAGKVQNCRVIKMTHGTSPLPPPRPARSQIIVKIIRGISKFSLLFFIHQLPSEVVQALKRQTKGTAAAHVSSRMSLPKFNSKPWDISKRLVFCVFWGLLGTSAGWLQLLLHFYSYCLASMVFGKRRERKIFIILLSTLNPFSLSSAEPRLSCMFVGSDLHNASLSTIVASFLFFMCWRSHEKFKQWVSLSPVWWRLLSANRCFLCIIQKVHPVVGP